MCVCAEEEGDENKMDISDQTGNKERSVRRQIYLTIMSSLDFEECAHKLLKTMGEGQEVGWTLQVCSPAIHHSLCLAEGDSPDVGGVL